MREPLTPVVPITGGMFAGWYDKVQRPDDGWVKDPTPFPVPTDSEQGAWEAPNLMIHFHQRLPRRILEIGTYQGGTLWRFATAAPPGAVIVSVDTPETHAEYEEQYRAWMPSHRELHLVSGDSNDAETRDKVVSLCPEFDWLYIDAAHTYEAARRDFNLYGPLVRPGGIIALHDIQINVRYPDFGVHRLWDEIREAGYVTQELCSRHGQGRYGTGVIFLP